jgi:formate dehydrogenase subunit delta
MSNLEHLIRQANRIGAFFEAMPDHTQALEDIANHVKKFWAPSLRREMLAFLEAHPDGRCDTTALSPISLEALTRFRGQLEPASVAQPPLAHPQA